MRRLTELLLIICFSFRPAGGFYNSPEAGGVPGERLSSFTASPKALAMGDAYASLSREAAGLYYNPASTSFTGHQSISVFYTPLPMRGSYASVFYSYPLILGSSAGIGLITLTSGEAERRNIWGGAEGSFREEERVLLLNLSRSLAENLGAGINLKFINKQIAGFGGSAWGADAGVIYSVSDDVSAGFRIQNIISPGLKLYRDTERFPLNIRAGISGYFLNRALLGAADIELIDAAGDYTLMRWHTGAEYVVLDMLRIRAGASYKGVSCGIGLVTDRFSYSYTLRYSGMGFFHSAGVAVSFGYLPTALEKELERRERLLRRREEVFEDWKDERQRDFLSRFDRQRRELDSELEEARRKNRELEALIEAALDINRGEYDRAESALRRILRDNPDSPDARDLLGMIQEDLRKEFSFGRMMAAYESGEYARAAREASRAGRDHPQYTQAVIIRHLAEARHSVLEGEYSKAEGILERLLEISPDNSHALSLLRRVRRLRELSE